MGLELPENADEVVQRSKTDVQRDLADSNPFLENSWLGALVTAAANRIFDFYIQLQEAINLNFPDTTTGEFLDRWASIYGVSRSAATQSSGNIAVRGDDLLVIPNATPFNSSDGLSYASTAQVTISDTTLAILSIVDPGGGVATVTTAVDHNLASNVPVTISGVVPTVYNEEQEIFVTAANQFEFTVSGNPGDASQVGTAEFIIASVPVRSVDFETVDQTVNQPLDAILTMGTLIEGVIPEAGVDFGTLGGGVPQESDTDLRNRLLSRIQNPVAHFSVSDIENQAKLVPGVTRVFVQAITPAVGRVTIFFMRDNDTDPIPDASEVATVSAKIAEIIPAVTNPEDVLVEAPVALPFAFAFTIGLLDPSTLTMQAAIIASLEQFFSETPEPGTDVDEDQYRSAIISTIDTATGDELESFVLTEPLGDIVVAAGKIATLGTVSFND